MLRMEMEILGKNTDIIIVIIVGHIDLCHIDLLHSAMYVYVRVEGRPSWWQTTAVLCVSQSPRSHTLPHTSPTHTSTLPLAELVFTPPTRRTCPISHGLTPEGGAAWENELHRIEAHRLERRTVLLHTWYTV